MGDYCIVINVIICVGVIKRLRVINGSSFGNFFLFYENFYYKFCDMLIGFVDNMIVGWGKRFVMDKRDWLFNG